MEAAARQNFWKTGFNPLDYCFISRYNCKIATDRYIQHTSSTGVDAVLLFTKELNYATGDCIFGHNGSDSGSGIDSQDFRFFIHATYPNCGLIFDRGNSRAYPPTFNVQNTNWHRTTVNGRTNVLYDNVEMLKDKSQTVDSTSCRFNFFQSYGQSTVNGAQNDVAIRYVRIYNTSTGQDIAYFVPDFEGMRDLVTDKVYKPVNADARFEVVKWKSLSEVEEWKDQNEGLALILPEIDEMMWKEAA